MYKQQQQLDSSLESRVFMRDLNRTCCACGQTVLLLRPWGSESHRSWTLWSRQFSKYMLVAYLFVVEVLLMHDCIPPCVVKCCLPASGHGPRQVPAYTEPGTSTLCSGHVMMCSAGPSLPLERQTMVLSCSEEAICIAPVV